MYQLNFIIARNDTRPYFPVAGNTDMWLVAWSLLISEFLLGQSFVSRNTFCT